MRITESDGRDVNWRPTTVTYRVWFATETTVWTFDLTDTDVEEALAWTRGEAGDRGWRLSVLVHSDRDGKGQAVLASGGNWESYHVDN